MADLVVVYEEDERYTLGGGFWPAVGSSEWPFVGFADEFDVDNPGSGVPDDRAYEGQAEMRELHRSILVRGDAGYAA